MQRTTLVILAISFVAFVASAAAVWWLHYESATAAQELNTMLQTIADKQQNEQEQRALANLLAATEQERSEVATYVINGESGVIQFLSLIDETAQQLGVALDTSSLAVIPEGRPPYQGLSVSYSFTGSETAVRAMVKAFEAVPYAKSIRALRVSQTIDPISGVAEVSGSIDLMFTMLSS